MKTLENTQVDNFIFDTLLIDPIQKIVDKLEGYEYRDCDINWLNDNLNKFTTYALQTLGKSFHLDAIGSTIMNDYVRDRFLKCFNILLNYFKSFE